MLVTEVTVYLILVTVMNLNIDSFRRSYFLMNLDYLTYNQR